MKIHWPPDFGMENGNGLPAEDRRSRDALQELSKANDVEFIARPQQLPFQWSRSATKPEATTGIVARLNKIDNGLILQLSTLDAIVMHRLARSD
jgi:hypothetical protein